jgi:bile acid:Na+ symporter, BASS family
MKKLGALVRNRNAILPLALLLGLLWGEPARWTASLTVPALAVVMTLSTLGVDGSVFRSFRTLFSGAVAGIAMNYFVLGGVILLLSRLFIRDEAIRIGFVLIAAVPPAVAVIPFTVFLKGDRTFSLFGMVGAYLSGLVLAPLIVMNFLGTGSFSPLRLILIMVELVLLPLCAARFLLWSGAASFIDPFKGAITNWSFFVLTYSIVGLNRETLIGRPLFLLPVVGIALASTFLLGWLIEIASRRLGFDSEKTVSLVLLGTLKNYGTAGALALALYSEHTAVPATVSTVFMTVYIIWLQIRNRRG